MRVWGNKHKQQIRINVKHTESCCLVKLNSNNILYEFLLHRPWLFLSWASKQMHFSDPEPNTTEIWLKTSASQTYEFLRFPYLPPWCRPLHESEQLDETQFWVLGFRALGFTEGGFGFRVCLGGLRFMV